MAKSETPPLWLVRKGMALVPEFEYDAERLQSFPQGERVKVTLHTGRIPKRLRFYWSFLHKVIEATGLPFSSESLHSLVKLECGYVTPVMLKGYQVNLPMSIAFDKMPEEEFSVFLTKAEEFIASTYGITPEMAFGKGEK